MNNFIPLSIPNFSGNEKKYVDEALEQGWVSTGGAYITLLEEKLQEFLGVESVTACQSGTAGIHLSLIECGVEPGDMVIVPTLTFIAAVNPVRYQFAEPIFMDCDTSLCMDPIKLRRFCENECEVKDMYLIHKKSGRKIKALIVVHVFGNLADMDEIMDIASEFKLKVIEDSTEALGTYYTKGKYKGKYAGTIGDFGVYSFNGNKIITTGGGGAVTSNSTERVAHMKYIATQAKDDSHFYIHNEIGYNYRMTNLQAALGVAQMEELADFIDNKHKNYDFYVEELKDFEYGSLLSFREGTRSNQWFYSLELEMEKINGTLEDIIKALQKEGIQTRAIWGLIHKQKPYRDKETYYINQATYYSQCILNLPCSTQITKSEMQYVVKKLKETLEAMKK